MCLQFLGGEWIDVAKSGCICSPFLLVILETSQGYIFPALILLLLQLYLGHDIIISQLLCGFVFLLFFFSFFRTTLQQYNCRFCCMFESCTMFLQMTYVCAFMRNKMARVSGKLLVILAKMMFTDRYKFSEPVYSQTCTDFCCSFAFFSF